MRSAQRVVDTLAAYGVRYIIGVPGAKIDAAFGARGIRVAGLGDFEATLTRSMSEPGITITDVSVDYSHNADLFAELREDAVE